MGLFGTQLVRIAADDEQQRQRGMDDAWAQYYGHVPDLLTPKPGGRDHNAKLNKPRVVVDKGASFLFGDDIKFLCDEHCPAGAQEWLDDCWKHNRQGSLLHDLAVAGGVTGHAFIKIALPEAGEEFPELTQEDAGMYSVVWNPRNIKDTLRYTAQWNGIDPDTHRAMNYRQRIIKQGARWQIFDEESQADSTQWVPTQSVDWPYPWPPVAQCKNLPAPNEWWGISDIGPDVLALNRQASFILSNLVAIIDWHGHPKTVATGVSGVDIDVDVDGVIVLPHPDAKMWNLEMHSDLAASKAVYEEIRDAVHELSRIPAISTGTLDKLGPLSGVALKVLYAPLLEKTNSKRTLYGEMLQEVCMRLLEIGGFGKVCSVTVTWPEMLPADPLQELQALLLMDQLGIISKKTMADKSQLDWEAEQKNLADEKPEEPQEAPAVPGAPGAAGENPAQTIPPPPVLNASPEKGMKPQGMG